MSEKKKIEVDGELWTRGSKKLGNQGKADQFLGLLHPGPNLGIL